MTGVPEKVLRWLYSVLPAEYADVTRTYHDVVEGLARYPSLAPRTEVYTYENGSSALLLLLSGTVSVLFRGATYSFPIAIWVPHAYPREPPLVYVRPAQDMVVRPGQHVAGDGRVYHPYLAQWAQYWDKSTIVDFLDVLRAVFAKEPPVRSRQATREAAPAPAPAPPPVPPPPPEWRRSLQGSQAASPSLALPPQAPAPPPKPPKAPGSNGDGPHAQSPQQGRYSQPPPLPAHPSQQPLRQSAYGLNNKPPVPHAMTSEGYPQSPINHELRQFGSPASPVSPRDQYLSRYQQPAPLPQAPAPVPHQPRQQPYPFSAHQPQIYSPQPPGPQPFQQLTQQYSHPPPFPYRGPPPPVQQQPPEPKTPINLLDDPLEVTIPSQSSDQVPLPVPPVPPNPEKDALLRALSSMLCAQIRDTVSSNTTAIAPLRAQQTALQTAYSRLESELQQLRQLDAALSDNERILKDTMVEADRVMEEARTRKPPDVDEILVAPTVVGGQLYEAVAEASSIGEVLFVLGKAVGRERVGADGFAKQTRSLAREQFLKKALALKIAKGMGLDIDQR